MELAQGDEMDKQAKTIVVMSATGQQGGPLAGGGPDSEEGSMFARVITAQVAPEKIDTAVRSSQGELPSVMQQQGFKGFYLLADHETGRLMTISLWETHEDALAVETRAAKFEARLHPT